jgi:hypothetical protein
MSFLSHKASSRYRRRGLELVLRHDCNAGLVVAGQLVTCSAVELHRCRLCSRQITLQSILGSRWLWMRQPEL